MFMAASRSIRLSPTRRETRSAGWSLAVTKFRVAGSVLRGNTKRPPYSPAATRTLPGRLGGEQAESRRTRRRPIEICARRLDRMLLLSLGGGVHVPRPDARQH